MGKHGVVRSPELQSKVVLEITAFCKGLNLEVMGTCESPLLGPAGNREFFIYAKKLLEENRSQRSEVRIQKKIIFILIPDL